MKKFVFNDETSIGIDVRIHVSGYFDPGRRSGDPDDCSAPEYEDDREIRSVSIDGKELPPGLVADLRPYLQPVIDGMTYLNGKLI